MKTTEQAQRSNQGKQPWGLVDFEAMRHLAPHYAGGWHGANWQALEEMLNVLIFGAKKYAPNNWKKGRPFMETANSIYRHLRSATLGQILDEETNLNQYGHVLCNLMFLSYWSDYRLDLDDRRPSAITRDYVVPAEEPINEQDAVKALLEVLGAWFNGTDNDPLTELPLLGYAMYYTCQAYAFQNGVRSGCVLVLDRAGFLGKDVAEIEKQFEDAKTTEVRKEALGFSIEPISNGNDFNVKRDLLEMAKNFESYNEPQQPDHGVII